MNRERLRQILQTLLPGLMGVTVLASGVSCSEQAFVPATLTTGQISPGDHVIPAKVDILLAQDDSPSMRQALPVVEQQMPILLDQLEARGWDYRFATTPLTVDRPIDQIVASKYDLNWELNGSGLWLPPFPGADFNDLTSFVLPSVFSAPEDYQGFIDTDDINWSVGQYENGFQSIRVALENHAPATDFIRRDAMLAVIVLGNGEDGSGLNLCNVTGLAGPVPCELDVYCGAPYSDPSAGEFHENCENPPNNEDTFNFYRHTFANLEGTATARLKFYSVVSFQNSQGGCLTSNSTIGFRYVRMAEELDGKAINICNQPVTNALDELAQVLISEKLEFRTRYIVLGEEPDPNTIEVIRYENGNPDSATSIPMDPDNGWTYVGGPTTVFTIDDPVEMNERTGFVIELHGDAKLVGEDSAEVKYQVPGVTESSG